MLRSPGAATLSVQMGEVIKDVAELKSDLDKFRREHGELHSAERRDRVVTRRWLVGTLIAALTLIEPPLLILLAHLH